MNDVPTPTQAMLLFGLLARHGESSQKDLTTVKKADREALAKSRLIGVAKVGRGLYLTLTDDGWAWAAAHLSAELPPAQQTLHEMLARLGEHLETFGETLADFIGSKPVTTPVETKPTKPKKSREPATQSASGEKKTKRSRAILDEAPTTPAPNNNSPAGARRKIEDAYLDITGGRTGTDVLLADLRARLPGIDHKTFDAALAEMHLESGKARLMRIESNRALTEADRQAAFHFKGNIFHVLWMES
jgi:hypothetical protein